MKKADPFHLGEIYNRSCFGDHSGGFPMPQHGPRKTRVSYWAGHCPFPFLPTWRDCDGTRKGRYWRKEGMKGEGVWKKAQGRPELGKRDGGVEKGSRSLRGKSRYREGVGSSPLLAPPERMWCSHHLCGGASP